MFFFLKRKLVNFFYYKKNIFICAVNSIINKIKNFSHQEHNTKEGITPTTIYKSIENILSSTSVADSIHNDDLDTIVNRKGDDFSNVDKKLAVDMMRKEMLEASENLQFEKAARLRDEINKLEKELEGIF